MRRSLAVALPLVAAACSFTNLDGFSGGKPAEPDGTLGDATTPKNVDASREATTETSGEAGPSTDPYGDAVRADTPTSWWRLEDPAGTTSVHDEMGVHDAQVMPRGTTVKIEFAVPGAVGKGARLGNQAGFFKVGDFFDFTGAAEFSLEAWVVDDDPAAEYEGIFNKRRDNDTGADSGWLIYLHTPNRSVGFQFWDTAQITSSTAATLPTGFHHVVLTSTTESSGLSYVLYIDGVSNGEGAAHDVTHNQPDTTKDLVIGFGWNGSLDELAVYEHPLPPERVVMHYRAGKP